MIDGNLYTHKHHKINHTFKITSGIDKTYDNNLSVDYYLYSIIEVILSMAGDKKITSR